MRGNQTGDQTLEVKRRRLEKKNVLLLISSLKIFSDKLSILEQVHNDSKVYSRFERQYEVVWIPIIVYYVPLTDETRTEFENLQSTMPRYTVGDRLLLEKPTIRFIKEVWHLKSEPILVVLDSTGEVVSPNAMLIWGSSAFPFHKLKKANTFSCTEGDNIKWDRRFTSTACGVADVSGIALEMFHMRKSNKKAKVKKVTKIINSEKLSHARVQLQSGKDDENDTTIQQIKKVRVFQINTRIPENMKCPECSRILEKYISLVCSHEAH
ncbi:hypothetical protein GQ457_05G010910 [Hibiscus cannabinus]